MLGHHQNICVAIKPGKRMRLPRVMWVCLEYSVEREESRPLRNSGGVEQGELSKEDSDSSLMVETKQLDIGYHSSSHLTGAPSLK